MATFSPLLISAALASWAMIHFYTRFNAGELSLADSARPVLVLIELIADIQHLTAFIFHQMVPMINLLGITTRKTQYQRAP